MSNMHGDTVVKISNKDLKFFNRGLKFQNNSEFAKAINIYKPLFFKYPTQYEISLNLASCYYELSDFISAVKIFHPLHEKYPNNTHLLNCCAVSYLGLGNYKLALDFLKLLVKAEPNNIDAWVNLTYTSNLLKNTTDSLYYATQALSLNPLEARLHSNLGSSLLNINRYTDALACYQTALELEPSHLNAITNIATIMDKLGLYSDSIQYYQHAQSLTQPNSKEENETLYRMSFPLLANGHLEKGWDLYDRGFTISDNKGRIPNRSFSKPKWNGQNIGDSTLLIWREQGVGDELWFFSLIDNVFPYCKNIIIECDRRLVSLLQRSFPNCSVRAEQIDKDVNYFGIEDFDFHIPAGSLCKIFRSSWEHFPKSLGYLIPDPLLVVKFKSLLEGYKDKLLVGISWRSGNLSTERNINYVPISEWKDILQLNHIQFVNLQYGDCQNELANVREYFGVEILNWNDIDIKNDFESLASLIVNLDLVISTTTFASPFTQALGVPLKMLVHSFWRNLGQSKWPWYEKVELYQPQSKSDSISTVFPNLLKDLTVQKK